MRPLRLMIALTVGSLAAAATASAGDVSFPPSIYPPPRQSPHWGLLGSCPSTQGVRPYERSSERAARSILLRFGRESLLYDLRHSDRALWQTIAVTWAARTSRKQPAGKPPIVVRSGPGSASPDASLVRTNCGSRILKASTWFSTCPAGATRRCSPALRGDFLLLNRRGHWLVWFEGQ
jgi:hypothetical protein